MDGWLINAIVLICGFLLGALVVARFYAKKIKVLGNLRIDRSDPYDGPYLFLELDEGLGSLKDGDYAKFLVVDKSLSSQE